MAKTANLNIRIDPSLKSDVERLYQQFGITVAEAVTIFFHQSLLSGGIPFDVRTPRNHGDSLAAAREAGDARAEC